MHAQYISLALFSHDKCHMMWPDLHVHYLYQKMSYMYNLTFCMYMYANTCTNSNFVRVLIN